MPDTSEATGPRLLVSIEQAGELLSIPYMSMWKLVNTQEVESRYIGRRRLVVLRSLHDYAENLPSEKSA